MLSHATRRSATPCLVLAHDELFPRKHVPTELNPSGIHLPKPVPESIFTSVFKAWAFGLGIGAILVGICLAILSH